MLKTITIPKTSTLDELISELQKVRETILWDKANIEVNSIKCLRLGEIAVVYEKDNMISVNEFFVGHPIDD